MNLNQSHITVFGSSFKGFLILLLALFLGTVTSCDFKHSIQHQFGFETTSNQNISKTTLDQSCGHSSVSISQSDQAKNLSQVKNKKLEGFKQSSFNFNNVINNYDRFSSLNDKSINLKSCPLFILYKKRKVLS